MFFKKMRSDLESIGFEVNPYNPCDANRTVTDHQHKIRWHLDASFAVHDDTKSHTGVLMSPGKGSIQSVSCKQKINTRSSTVTELRSII
jgi:hypothetical protein